MAARKTIKVKNEEPVLETPVIDPPVNPKMKFVALGLLAIIILAALLWKFKTLFVVAVVNGRPITRYELESRIMNRYGKQALDEIVNERIVKEKAERDNINVTGAEIDTKITDLTKLLAGQTSIDAALAQQRMTMADLRKQLALQILVEKIASPEVKIDDKEITDFIAQNKTYMQATEDAAVRKEAADTLRRQKVSQIFQKIFSDLKNKARIINLLTLQTPF